MSIQQNEEWNVSSQNVSGSGDDVQATQSSSASSNTEPRTKASTCFFSFDQIPPVTDTSTMQTFRQNSSMFVPTNTFTQTCSSINTQPYSSSPWPLPQSAFPPHPPIRSPVPRPIFSPSSPIGTFGEHMYQIQRIHLSNMQLDRYPISRPMYSPGMQFNQQITRPPLWRPHANIGEVRTRPELIPSQMHFPGPFDTPQQTLPTYHQDPSIHMEHSYPRPWNRMPQQVEHPKSSVVRPIPLYAASGVVGPPPIISRPPSSVVAPNPSSQKNAVWNSSKPEAVWKRKKNSRIDEKTNALFEKQFQQNKSPSQAEICDMCEAHNLTKGAVRTWFSGRRQKQKQTEKEHAMQALHREQVKVPSEDYDITVEVPSINPRDRGSVIHQDYKN